jgi:hypothetical protein
MAPFYSEVTKVLFELLSTRVSQQLSRNHCDLICYFPGRHLGFDRLVKMMDGGTDYADFRIPQFVCRSSDHGKASFVRGAADVAGSVENQSDPPWMEKRRVVIRVMNNWHLPLEICQLLQKDLKVPIQCILWGHPNTRDPKARRKSIPVGEHQIRVLADAFHPIGFHIKSKAEAFSRLAEFDLVAKPASRYCNPLALRDLPRAKPHPREDSLEIPKQVRGRHFNSNREICRAIGCQQWKCDERRQTINTQS